MDRDRDERREDRLEQMEERTSDGVRYPVQVRATFIRIDRTPREQASAA
jgi:hypothetical protein